MLIRGLPHSVVGIVAIAFLVGPSAAEERFRCSSFLGETPPELVARDDHWMNVDRTVTLKSLHGKVVWLQFNF